MHTRTHTHTHAHTHTHTSTRAYTPVNASITIIINLKLKEVYYSTDISEAVTYWGVFGGCVRRALLFARAHHTHRHAERAAQLQGLVHDLKLLIQGVLLQGRRNALECIGVQLKNDALSSVCVWPSSSLQTFGLSAPAGGRNAW
jgi:hypothetical protein